MGALLLLYMLCGWLGGLLTAWQFLNLEWVKERLRARVLGGRPTDEVHAAGVDCSQCPRCGYDIPELDFVDADADDDTPS